MSNQQYTGDDEDGFMPSSSSSRRTKLIPEDSIPARKLWLYGFCACIVLSLMIVVGIVIFSWYRGGVDHHHVDQMIAELNEDNTMQMDTKNMVSFSAISSEAQSSRLIKHNNRLSLCYADLLRSDTDDGKTPLYVNVDQLSDDKNPYYYMLDLKLTLTFDVNALLYMREANQYEMSRRYMTIAYLITSSYTRFSTIKLIETGLDTKNKALIRTNEIILCSDNPNSQNTRACSTTLTEEGSLFIKNTKLLTMSKLVPWIGAKDKGERKNVTQPNRVVPQPVNDVPITTENGQYDIVHTDGTMHTYKLADDFTRDLRMYNIVFYRLAPTDESSARYTTFKEVPVLTLKPSKCK